ncbi:ABC transporter substrate-binding protein [Aquibaculum arenosum]|uniref:ABC transporter substrate-binding protein n=1 Tax=Aquibaculum arenosum TaxID=3032591 RepID=A0ABT5YNP1_9PROT|nr:ABC transporter substrate-binding protein [Fodinicurvata sp. CAU 1616]MDF2096587.1 ABC transporter substrate-binding protein [Fodinicurvata sp. CAU 1616]
MRLAKTMPVLAAAGVMSLLVAPAKAVDLTVTHWGVLMYGVPFAVAWDQGYFEEEGIEVDGFITSQGGGTTLRNALASEVPYGETALAAVVAAAHEGLDLTIVHAGVRSVGDLLWATRSDAEDVNEIDDLKGRPVGYTSPRSVSQSVLFMSMDAAGIATDDYDPRSLGGVGSGLTALDEGVVDAALVLEPVWTRLQDKYKPVFFAGDLLPPMTQTVGVVRTDYLEENGDTIRGIIEARRRGVEFIYDNPREAGEILARVYDMDEEIAITAVENVAAIDYWSRGDFEIEAMNNMLDGLRLVDAIDDGPFDWSGLIDERYLPEDLQGE